MINWIWFLLNKYEEIKTIATCRCIGARVFYQKHKVDHSLSASSSPLHWAFLDLLKVRFQPLIVFFHTKFCFLNFIHLSNRIWNGLTEGQAVENEKLRAHLGVNLSRFLSHSNSDFALDRGLERALHCWFGFTCWSIIRASLGTEYVFYWSFEFSKELQPQIMFFAT